MLVKDGQEIKPDQEEESEDQKDDLQLSNEEIEEAVRAYAEYKRGMTRKTQPQQKPLNDEDADYLNDVVKKQSATKAKQQAAHNNDAYGEYERVPAKQQVQDDDDDYPTGLRAFLQSLSHINIKAVGVGLLVLVFAVAAINSYRRGKAEVTATPTVAPVSAPVEQPVQSNQPVVSNPNSCKVTEMKVSTMTDQTDPAENTYCLIAMDDGSTISTAGACSASQWHVGDSAVTCK